MFSGLRNVTLSEQTWRSTQALPYRQDVVKMLQVICCNISEMNTDSAKADSRKLYMQLGLHDELVWSPDNILLH